MTKVCRLCLMKLQRGSKYFNINAVESFTGFMPYRDQLTTCIPEMALDLIPNPVICNNCRTALKASYDFKSRCLFVEKKIQQYIEGQNYNQFSQINYDLSQIPTDDVPHINKLALLIVPKNNDHEQEEGLLQPETFLKIQSEEPLQILESLEAESDNFNASNVSKEESEESTSFASTPSPNDKKYHKPHRSYRGIYPRSRLSVSRICSEDEFVCNFCHESFRSLQLLRKHNNICSKSTQQESTKNILTKRPHLPTKAKNHLKKWLFRHTEHPYPTDQEKQMLMKETNLSLLQVENWFINARRRILQDLTKLKSRGLRSGKGKSGRTWTIRKKRIRSREKEDIYDSSLGLEMDFEELVPQNRINAQNVPPDPLEGPADPTEMVTLPGPSVDMVKEEEDSDGDIEEEHVDLLKVKCEMVESR